MLGLPKVLREEDIHAEYPSDCDDEYVTERGFQPTLPGEYTKISSALALFRLSRVLAKVLEKNYPASTSYELSLQGISSLDAELAEWSEKLPAHLKLTFAQDKPSTEVTGSRSPLLVSTLLLLDAPVQTLTVTGPRILLHANSCSSPSGRLFSGAQRCAVADGHFRGQQAHNSNHPAPRGEEHVILVLSE